MEGLHSRERKQTKQWMEQFQELRESNCAKKNALTSLVGAKLMNSFSYPWERIISPLKILLWFNCHFTFAQYPIFFKP